MGLVEQNEEARRIILGGRDDPENTKMTDGRTVAQHQAEMLAEHTAEGQAASDLQTQRMRDLSMRDDPFYATPSAPDKSTSRGPRTLTSGPIQGKPPAIEKAAGETV